MVRMTVGMLATMLAAAPAMAQTATGQQNNQPSANQNQSQQQTDSNQQPGNVRVLPPSADAQTQPNPLPQLSK